MQKQKESAHYRTSDNDATFNYIAPSATDGSSYSAG
jgi:hypothetical protein